MAQQISSVSFDRGFLFVFFLVSNETREALLDWSKHDDETERFCVVDGNSSQRPDEHGVDYSNHSETSSSFF